MVQHGQLAQGGRALQRGGRRLSPEAPAGGSAGFADFYRAGYALPAPEAERGGRWRALGARSKADHLQRLCAEAAVAPRTVVEIGCGDGALLAELSARGLGERLEGYELSETAAAIARGRSLPRVEAIGIFDGARLPVADGAFELAVLSHVLEHVPDPGALLAEAVRVASVVAVEVPLESNRSARRPRKRAQAARIGHVQAFSREDLRRLAGAAGLRIEGELSDPLDAEHHMFFATTRPARARAALKAGVRRALWRLAPLAGERLFTVHYACLLRTRP